MLCDDDVVRRHTVPDELDESCASEAEMSGQSPNADKPAAVESVQMQTQTGRPVSTEKLTGRP